MPKSIKLLMETNLVMSLSEAIIKAFVWNANAKIAQIDMCHVEYESF